MYQHINQVNIQNENWSTALAPLENTAGQTAAKFPIVFSALWNRGRTVMSS